LRFAEINDKVEHNGHVEAAAALARIAGAAVAPFMQPLAAARPGTVHCAWLLAVASCVLALACSSSLLAAYAWYVVVMGMLQLQLCVVQAQAAILVFTVDAAQLFGILHLCSILMQSLGQVTNHHAPVVVASCAAVPAVLLLRETTFECNFRMELFSGAAASKWLECETAVCCSRIVGCVRECMLWSLVDLKRPYSTCPGALILILVHATASAMWRMPKLCSEEDGAAIRAGRVLEEPID
jgi:hypothetical protein